MDFTTMGLSLDVSPEWSICGTHRAIPGKVFLPGFDGFPCEDKIDYNNFISNDYDCATIQPQAAQQVAQ
eukprot:scaffold6163_cov78-Cylindrotheca_fusiformis.AAC.1